VRSNAGMTKHTKGTSTCASRKSPPVVSFSIGWFLDWLAIRFEVHTKRINALRRPNVEFYMCVRKIAKSDC
jgi:hypothetical protein